MHNFTATLKREFTNNVWQVTFDEDFDVVTAYYNDVKVKLTVKIETALFNFFNKNLDLNELLHQSNYKD